VLRQSVVASLNVRLLRHSGELVSNTSMAVLFVYIIYIVRVPDFSAQTAACFRLLLGLADIEYSLACLGFSKGPSVRPSQNGIKLPFRDL
jgi:hypothetical protein